MTADLHVKATLSGKTILITGTTGFVGKALLEKLVRSVPDISKIILLIRANAEFSSASARFWGDVYPSSIFEFLRNQNEMAFRTYCEQRVQCLTGEITEQKFGLEDDVYQSLVEQVDLVINSAASVNFREPIDDALQINTLCLEHLIGFLKEGGNIPLVHISTCYVNGFNKGVQLEKQVRPARKVIPKDEAGHPDLLPLIGSLQRKAEHIRQKEKNPERAKDQLIDLGIKVANEYGWNDTYTFTKWMGEQILIKTLDQQRLTILRPSIVESALQDPTPGWIEGVKVADAIILAYARRRFSFFPANRSGVVDIVPVDQVVNSVILSAAEIFKRDPGLRIYQCCSSEQNPLTIAQYMAFVIDELRDSWRQFPKLTKNKAPKKKLKVVGRKTFLALMRSLRSLLKARQKVMPNDSSLKDQLKSLDVTMSLSTIYSFYTNPKSTYSNKQLIELFSGVSNSEREEFSVDASAIDWQKYLREVHLKGLEQYGLDR